MVRGNFLLSAGDTTTPTDFDLARSGFVFYPAALYGSLTAESWAWQQLVYQRAYAQAQAAMFREQTGLYERISSILGPAWRN